MVLAPKCGLHGASRWISVLATFCCSHHVTLERFKEMISDACVDAKKTVRQLALYTQNADHPILPTIPETEYLKGLVCRVG